MNENSSFTKKWVIYNKVFTCYFHMEGGIWNCIGRYDNPSLHKFYYFSAESKEEALVLCDQYIKNHLQ